jgi:endo-1,4-beta-xylanase
LTSNAEYRATVEAEFSQITPENEMKWESLAPTRDSFKWTQADVLVSFAEENGMTVHGHTLVWHSQLPSWVTTLSTDEVEGAMNEHIDAVVSRYRGRIRSWDVVNEALADTGALRVSPFSAALGEEFIDKAFAAARSADPDAILFYNDYGIEHLGPKSDALFALVKRLLERGVPIQGVGFQMHIASTGNPSASSFRDNLARFAALGLHTSITEMDVRIGKSTADTKTALSNQAERYYEIIRVCRLQPKCGTITFWGVDDGHSWLDLPSMEGVFGKGPHQGLLFDTHFDPKPAYDRARDALD